LLNKQKEGIWNLNPLLFLSPICPKPFENIQRGVEAGVLDQPFSTTKYVAGRVMGARDNEGAVRYLDHGNLPFTKKIVEFHKEKIREREKAQGKKVDYGTVIDDIYAISRGPLVTRK